MPRTRKRGAAYLNNVLAFREKTKRSTQRALNLARITQRNYNGIRAANENYRTAIDRAAQAILFPPTELHFGIYSRIVAPIRFEETRAIVHARLPTDALRGIIADHARYANQAAAIAQRMAEQARRLRMHDIHAGDYETERRAATATVQKINRNAAALETLLQSQDIATIQTEDEAFEVIRALSLPPKAPAVEPSGVDVLSTYQFILRTSADPANKYKGKRLQAIVMHVQSGKAPQPFEIPHTIVRDNLPVLTKWIDVSLHLIKAMKAAQAPTNLQYNQTKNRDTVVDVFRSENLIAMYKITALVAWLAWKAREASLFKTTRAPTKEELKDEVRALDAELMFYTVYRDWLSFILQNRSNPVGKMEMERQLALLTEADKPGGWIPLRREHAKLKRMNAARSPAASPISSPVASRVASPAPSRPASPSRITT